MIGDIIFASVQPDRKKNSKLRGHPVEVKIRRTMHLSSAMPADDTSLEKATEIFLAMRGDRTWDL